MIPKRTEGLYASHVLTIPPIGRRLTACPHHGFAAPKVPRCGQCSLVVLRMKVCRGSPLVWGRAHRLSLRAMRGQRLSMDPELWAGAEDTAVVEERRTQAMKSRHPL